MRRLSLLFAALLVLPLLGSDSPKEYDDRTETAGIEGTWRAMEYEFKGTTGKPTRQCVMTFRGGTLTSPWSDGDLWQGSYRIDPTRQPPHLDWIPSKGFYEGTTLKAICQIDGDTLRIAYFDGRFTKQRPQGFNDKGVIVWVHKREK